MNIVQSSAVPLTSIRKIFWLLVLGILSVSFSVHSESQESDADSSDNSSGAEFIDMRTLVEIPDKPRMILQEDMLDHLAVLNEINRYLAKGDLKSAAEVAESGMGKSLLSKYQDVDMRPGRYMPQPMREIGWELHAAAGEFAKVARQGDMQKTLLAYHRIISACVACHYSYRTR